VVNTGRPFGNIEMGDSHRPQPIDLLACSSPESTCFMSRPEAFESRHWRRAMLCAGIAVFPCGSQVPLPAGIGIATNLGFPSGWGLGPETQRLRLPECRPAAYLWGVERLFGRSDKRIRKGKWVGSWVGGFEVDLVNLWRNKYGHERTLGGPPGRHTGELCLAARPSCPPRPTAGPRALAAAARLQKRRWLAPMRPSRSASTRRLRQQSLLGDVLTFLS